MSTPNSNAHASDSLHNTGTAAPTSNRLDHEVDPELNDWDAYVRMLLSGRLSQFAGEFVVIHQGNVISHGSDLEKLRSSAAERLGVAAGKIVIPFVDNSECITLE
jgi:hypothetical protein